MKYEKNTVYIFENLFVIMENITLNLSEEIIDFLNSKRKENENLIDTISRLLKFLKNQETNQKWIVALEEAFEDYERTFKNLAE